MCICVFVFQLVNLFVCAYFAFSLIHSIHMYNRNFINTINETSISCYHVQQQRKMKIVKLCIISSLLLNTIMSILLLKHSRCFKSFINKTKKLNKKRTIIMACFVDDVFFIGDHLCKNFIILNDKHLTIVSDFESKRGKYNTATIVN